MFHFWFNTFFVTDEEVADPADLVFKGTTSGLKYNPSLNRSSSMQPPSYGNQTLTAGSQTRTAIPSRRDSTESKGRSRSSKTTLARKASTGTASGATASTDGRNSTQSVKQAPGLGKSSADRPSEVKKPHTNESVTLRQPNSRSGSRASSFADGSSSRRGSAVSVRNSQIFDATDEGLSRRSSTQSSRISSRQGGSAESCNAGNRRGGSLYGARSGQQGRDSGVQNGANVKSSQSSKLSHTTGSMASLRLTDRNEGSTVSRRENAAVPGSRNTNVGEAALDGHECDRTQNGTGNKSRDEDDVFRADNGKRVESRSGLNSVSSTAPRKQPSSNAVAGIVGRSDSLHGSRAARSSPAAAASKTSPRVENSQHPVGTPVTTSGRYMRRDVVTKSARGLLPSTSYSPDVRHDFDHTPVFKLNGSAHRLGVVRNERLQSDPVALTNYTSHKQDHFAAVPSPAMDRERKSSTSVTVFSTADVSGVLPTKWRTLTIPKCEIDKANKDTQNKLYSAGFKVTLCFFIFLFLTGQKSFI
jgi:hypothetical protein